MSAEPSRSQSTTVLPTPSSGGRPAAVELPRHEPPDEQATGKRLAILALTALGVVYGDIGTSPLYAFREGFNGDYAVAPTVANVYGILSLIVWALTLVVSIKYLTFVLRADNRGEGGILALLALIQQRLHRKSDVFRRHVLVPLGLFGAALLYGDGVITPSITVLSAIEGLEVVTPTLQRLVVPISVIILVALFLLQRHGTHRVGSFFGPVMVIWFATIAIFGLLEIAREPQILMAIYPGYAIAFFRENHLHGFFILGAVVLVLTGAEALYADMGHFGRRPIRLAWFFLVFPSLLLNYFGQGALLLRDASAASNPFFRLVPPPLLYPMVLLATVAAIIASQALISGAFSLTQQAMQLGYSPRMTVTHTSRAEAGQIFIPEVNKVLLVGCIVLVIGFGSSSALAAAYGIAVTGTMVITTVLYFVIARQRWWHDAPAKAWTFLVIFLVIDIAFFLANAIKIEHGGWVPIAIAVAVYTLMATWKRGRSSLREILRSSSLPMGLFLDDVRRRKPPRVPGTAVFMTSETEGAPVVLLHHLKHNKVLHDQVILLSVITEDIPEVPPSERVHVEPLGEGFYRVTARYGFMQTPNVPFVMSCCEPMGIRIRPSETSYYLGREQLIPTGHAKMSRWRKKLFVLMSRNARAATQFFGLPPNRVVELGAQIEF